MLKSGVEITGIEQSNLCQNIIENNKQQGADVMTRRRLQLASHMIGRDESQEGERGRRGGLDVVCVASVSVGFSALSRHFRFRGIFAFRKALYYGNACYAG